MQASADSFRLRCAVASDGHFGQPETNYRRFHREMVAWLNEEAKGKGLDFVVLNGDLIHDRGDFLSEVKLSFSDLRIPFYVVKGNHDMVSPSRWEETWGYGENHDFEHEEYAILLGTTSNEKGEYLCANRSWLSDRLRRYRGKRYVFVFLHICQNGLTRHSVNCPEISAELGSAPNVAAVFHGHDHDIDNVIYCENLAYFYDGHIGGSWGTNYRGYRILEIDKGHQITTYQCNPEAFIVNSARIA